MAKDTQDRCGCNYRYRILRTESGSSSSFTLRCGDCGGRIKFSRQYARWLCEVVRDFVERRDDLEELDEIVNLAVEKAVEKHKAETLKAIEELLFLHGS
ncbi:MAG: hypothetical protein OXR72_07485 [Gemmatimonadota bacterium]|nr:hypothetical protein [Gemmatimonadota bacterium]